MFEAEMYERSFQRPRNFFKLSERRQWEIDDALGILDWCGVMNAEQRSRFEEHYDVILDK